MSAGHRVLLTELRSKVVKLVTLAFHFWMGLEFDSDQGVDFSQRVPGEDRLASLRHGFGISIRRPLRHGNCKSLK